MVIKKLYVFLLVFILLAPAGIAVIALFDDDQSTCELFENLSEEEEEEDDQETENEEENQFIREFYITKSEYSIIAESAVKESAETTLIPYSICQEVQTPPPELS